MQYAGKYGSQGVFWATGLESPINVAARIKKCGSHMGGRHLRMIFYARKLSCTDGGWLHDNLPFCSPPGCEKGWSGQGAILFETRQDRLAVRSGKDAL